jgi:hypothetical protein
MRSALNRYESGDLVRLRVHGDNGQAHYLYGYVLGAVPGGVAIFLEEGFVWHAQPHEIVERL